MKNTYKTIKIDTDTHDKLKKYCKKHNLKLNSWVNSLIFSQISQIEHLENVPYPPQYKFKEK